MSTPKRIYTAGERAGFFSADKTKTSALENPVEYLRADLATDLLAACEAANTVITSNGGVDLDKALGYDKGIGSQLEAAITKAKS